MTVAYLDTSAAMKLVLQEPEPASLTDLLVSGENGDAATRATSNFARSAT